ncbi:MAG: sulfotransferase family 2 domain-containing protein [Pseudomonadota bacterium]
MIVSAVHNFGFVHIPKCAGSTIRHQLRERDDLKGRFYRNIAHPTLGRINGNHLTLAVLRQEYPDAFAALQAVESYTIVRDPTERFVSAVAQAVRDEGGEAGALSARQIAVLAHRLIGELERAEGVLTGVHILFERQIEYVMLDGSSIVDHVFPMERLDALFEAMATRHDLHLNRETVWNPTVTYRFPALTKTLKRMKDRAKKTLPVAGYTRLRDAALPIFTTRGVPKLNQTLLEDDRIQAFIAERYAEDAALHRTALAALAAPDTQPEVARA